jgi:KDO2-lipid IV(A) lauroyltransferase
VANVLSLLLMHVFRYRRKVILDNLQMVYGDELPMEETALLRNIYRNFIYLWMEFLQANIKKRDDMLKSCRFHNLELLDKALEQGKGVVLVTGHLGNFEWFAYVLAMQGYKIFGVAKRQSNPWINAMIHDSRRQFGTEIIYVKNAMKEGLKELQNGHILGLVADQDAKHRGVFVDFLGIPSSTAVGPAVYNLRSGAPIMFCAAIRRDYADFDIYFERPFDTTGMELNDENIEAITRMHVSALERWVRKYPEQWFWTHRRWKTRPQQIERKEAETAS